MRQDDQKDSLLDYVKFVVSAPVAPALQGDISAIERAHQRLKTCGAGPLEESFLALNLVELLYRLRDKKLRLGV